LEYYVQIERGRLGGVSDKALIAVMQALQLDQVARDHFVNLASRLRGESLASAVGRTGAVDAPAGLQTVMDSMHGVAAVVQNSLLDIVASNALARALYAPVFDTLVPPANIAMFVFLDTRAEEFFADWTTFADVTVATIRVETGRFPDDRSLTALVRLLNARSEGFATRWAKHEVARKPRGMTTIIHPLTGRMDLNFESLDVPGCLGLTLVTYSAGPDTTTHRKLWKLAAT
jgi:hypothetical protein